MEEKLLKCPNCGANATNHQNCEYCGSLLVRFVDKGIDLSQTCYLTNDEVIPGLIEQLKQNLRMQENSDEYVATDIYHEIGKNPEDCHILSIDGSKSAVWEYDDDENASTIFSGVDKGLCIKLVFDFYDDESLGTNREDNIKLKEKLERFEQLESYKLFVTHITTDIEFEGRGYAKSKQYAIDFGSDVEGAARLISEIVQKVYQIPTNERLEMFTNQGYNIADAQFKYFKASGIQIHTDDANNSNSSDEDGIPNWVWAVGGIILFLLIKACS